MKRYIYLIISTLIIFTFCSGIAAQGQFLLDTTQNCVGLNFDLSKTNNLKFYSASLGYSIKGILDFRLGYGRSENYSDRYTDFDYYSEAININLTYHPLRQSEKSIINLKITGAIQVEDIPKLNSDNLNTFIINPSVYTNVSLGSNFYFQPSAGFGLMHTFVVDGKDDEQTFVGLYPSVFLNTNRNIVAITTAIISHDIGTSYLVEFGYYLKF